MQMFSEEKTQNSEFNDEHSAEYAYHHKQVNEWWIYEYQHINVIWLMIYSMNREREREKEKIGAFMCVYEMFSIENQNNLSFGFIGIGLMDEISGKIRTNTNK